MQQENQIYTLISDRVCVRIYKWKVCNTGNAGSDPYKK